MNAQIDFEQLAEDIVDKVIEVDPYNGHTVEHTKAAVLKLLRPLREALDKNWTAPKVGNPINKPGYDALWGWFGLSYASFLVMPRVLMHEMPDEWQGKMAALEYATTFCEWPEGMGSRVQTTMHGKIVKTPGWLINYRHPDWNEINKLRGAETKVA